MKLKDKRLEKAEKRELWWPTSRDHNDRHNDHDPASPYYHTTTPSYHTTQCGPHHHLKPYHTFASLTGDPASASVVAAEAYSGASFLQWPHLLIKHGHVVCCGWFWLVVVDFGLLWLVGDNIFSTDLSLKKRTTREQAACSGRTFYWKCWFSFVLFFWSTWCLERSKREGKIICF